MLSRISVACRRSLMTRCKVLHGWPTPCVFTGSASYHSRGGMVQVTQSFPLQNRRAGCINSLVLSRDKEVSTKSSSWFQQRFCCNSPKTAPLTPQDEERYQKDEKSKETITSSTETSRGETTSSERTQKEKKESNCEEKSKSNADVDDSTISSLSFSEIRKKGMRQLIKEIGLPIVLYYFLLNEFGVVVLTVALEYGWLGGGDIIMILQYAGIPNEVIQSYMSSTFTIFGFAIRAQLVTHFFLASLFFSLWTPLQWAFVFATFPRLRRAFLRKRGAKKMKNTFQDVKVQNK